MPNIFPSFDSFLGCCIHKTSFSVFPVHNLPYLLHIVWSYIFVVNVVCMLPHIDSWINEFFYLKEGSIHREPSFLCWPTPKFSKTLRCDPIRAIPILILGLGQSFLWILRLNFHMSQTDWPLALWRGNFDQGIGLLLRRLGPSFTNR